MKKNFHWQFNEQQFKNKKDSNDKQEVISYEWHKNLFCVVHKIH